jgi:hypothetical protein
MVLQTLLFTLNKNKNSVNLYQYYDGKSNLRSDTRWIFWIFFIDSVVGVFYGNHGVFVSPSHRALAIAKEEGKKKATRRECILEYPLRVASSSLLLLRHRPCEPRLASYVITERHVNIYSHLILFVSVSPISAERSGWPARTWIWRGSPGRAILHCSSVAPRSCDRQVHWCFYLLLTYLPGQKGSQCTLQTMCRYRPRARGLAETFDCWQDSS